ncbi:MAG: glycosyltransferase family 39 protein, partial [Chloroflexi bacterium]|nr:glycosyltransferase family 39 protein [Chloroflexota bacterium]
MPDARSIETTQPFTLTAPPPARTMSRRGRRLEQLRVFLKSRWLFTALLMAIVLALYAASINFGLIWDDPKWYQQGAGQSLGQLFTSLDTYQFYRPLAIGLNRLLVSPAGLVNAPLAHLIQIAAHLIATLAVVPLLRVFKIDDRAARISAILFAIYPLSYQAVAWQAPQQPIATLAVFVALLAAHRFIQRDQLRYLIASLAAYAFALLFQESALPFVAGFFWLALLNRHSAPQVSRQVSFPGDAPLKNSPTGVTPHLPVGAGVPNGVRNLSRGRLSSRQCQRFLSRNPSTPLRSA